MTKIKLCGLMRPCDVEAANRLKPDYIGFVLVPGKRRYITPEHAAELRQMLSPDILAVGVFIDEKPEQVAALLNSGVIDIAQLHGGEDAKYIRRLRSMTPNPLIKFYRIASEEDIENARTSTADYVLLDSGAGTGKVFDWKLTGRMDRPYFLAGGLTPENVTEALRKLHPYAVDVSSGIETDGMKDPDKMSAFVSAVRSYRINSYEEAKL